MAIKCLEKENICVIENNTTNRIRKIRHYLDLDHLYIMKICIKYPCLLVHKLFRPLYCLFLTIFLSIIYNIKGIWNLHHYHAIFMRIFVSQMIADTWRSIICFLFFFVMFHKFRKKNNIIII